MVVRGTVAEDSELLDIGVFRPRLDCGPVEVEIELKIEPVEASSVVEAEVLETELLEIKLLKIGVLEAPKILETEELLKGVKPPDVEIELRLGVSGIDKLLETLAAVEDGLELEAKGLTNGVIVLETGRELAEAVKPGKIRDVAEVEGLLEAPMLVPSSDCGVMVGGEMVRLGDTPESSLLKVKLTDTVLNVWSVIGVAIFENIVALGETSEERLNVVLESPGSGIPGLNAEGRTFWTVALSNAFNDVESPVKADLIKDVIEDDTPDVGVAKVLNEVRDKLVSAAVPEDDCIVLESAVALREIGVNERMLDVIDDPEALITDWPDVSDAEMLVLENGDKVGLDALEMIDIGVNALMLAKREPADDRVELTPAERSESGVSEDYLSQMRTQPPGSWVDLTSMKGLRKCLNPKLIQRFDSLGMRRAARPKW